MRAQVAEIDGREQDALMMDRSALDTRGPKLPVAEENDKLADNFQCLWKQMSGTQEGLEMLVGKKKIVAATERANGSDQKTPPSFSLRKNLDAHLNEYSSSLSPKNMGQKYGCPHCRSKFNGRFVGREV